MWAFPFPTHALGTRPQFARRSWLGALFLTFALLTTTANADVSLRLGTVLPGWDEVDARGQNAELHDAGLDLGRRYATQLGRYCGLPEVFFRDGSNAILTAEPFYEPYLPAGSREEVLLETIEHRVSVVRPRVGSSLLVVMFRVRGAGVGLVVCG